MVSLNGAIEITKVKKLTKAKFFENLRPGHVVHMSLSIKRPGRSARGLYATWLALTNITTGETGTVSLSVLTTRLNSFEYIEKRGV